jgi:hypothetical protein
MISIFIITLIGLTIQRAPEFGEGKRQMPNNVEISPELDLLNFNNNYSMTFDVPINFWVFNHALLDIHVSNVEIKANLLDEYQKPHPDFKITGESGLLVFKATTNNSISLTIQGEFNFNLGSIRKHFKGCQSDLKGVSFHYDAKISMKPLTWFGIRPVKSGAVVMPCPDFLNNGLLGGIEKLGENGFNLDNIVNQFLSRKRN